MLHPSDGDRTTSGIGVPEPAARAQLEEILASRVFSKSERLSRFLRFVVEQTLEGRAASLKEPVLATELYGRSTDFNAAMDPAVRIDARRLRDKLREYYSEHADAPVVITVPRGGYVPSFETNSQKTSPTTIEQPPPDSAPEPLKRSRPGLTWKQGAVVAGVVVVGSLAMWLVYPTEQRARPTLLPLTSSPGNEWWPALSPDGNFVAFMCAAAAQQGVADICVKAVGAEAVQRVVESPAAESRPAWSPDGREIAFARHVGGKEQGIFIVSRIGGSERRISDTGTGVVWTPDGESVLIRDRSGAEPAPFGLFRVNLRTLQRRRVTQPELGGGDWSFEVSPDGRNVAFIRYERPGVSDLFVMPLNGGELRRLTDWNTILWGPAWTPDGKELVYAADDRLWRIPATAGKPARGSQIPDLPVAATHVSISRPLGTQRTRLAFHAPQQQITLRRIDLAANDARGVLRSTAVFAPATRRDIPGRFSPDGSKVAFTSTRSSAGYELWVANSDGSLPRQLTSTGSDGLMLAHAWSPDGRRILFETAVQGNSELFVVSTEGGNVVRLTDRREIEALAEWSRDGQWIYFTRVASGMHASVWRMPAAGGTPMRITTGAGSEPQVSPDGKYIYYLDRPPLDGTDTARLMRVPESGGEAQYVFDGIRPLYWSVTDKGIYFLRIDGQVHSIWLLRPGDGRVDQIGVLPVRVTHRPLGRGRLTVSRDGRWALVNVTDRWEGDLMLLDNFR